MQIIQPTIKLEADPDDLLMVRGDSFTATEEKENSMLKTFKLEENQSDSDENDGVSVLELSGMSPPFNPNLIKQCSDVSEDSIQTPTHIDKQHIKREVKSELNDDMEDSDLESSVTLMQSKDSSLLTGVLKTPSRSKVPNGFVQSSASLPLYRKDPKKEFWLLQVPAGFDVKCLDNTLRMPLVEKGGIQRVKIKTEENKQIYSVHICRNSCSQRKLSTLATKPSNKIVLGDIVPHTMIVRERLEAPCVAAALDLPHVAMPQIPVHTNLKIRFTSFGADKPQGTLASTVPQKVRKRKKDDSDSVHPKAKKLKVEPAETREDVLDFAHPIVKKIKVEPPESREDVLDFGHPIVKKIKVEPPESREDDLDFAHLKLKKPKVEPSESRGEMLPCLDVSEMHESPKRAKIKKHHKHETVTKLGAGVFAGYGNPHQDSFSSEFSLSPSPRKQELSVSDEWRSENGEVLTIVPTQSRKDKKSKRHQVGGEMSATVEGVGGLHVTDYGSEQPSRKHKKSKRHRGEMAMPSTLSQANYFVVDRGGETIVSEASDLPVKHKKSKKKKIKVEKQ